MIRRPPRSTLSPYTTLFRSGRTTTARWRSTCGSTGSYPPRRGAGLNSRLDSHLVAAALLRAVERAVGRLDDQLRLGVALVFLRHADADGDGHALPRAPVRHHLLLLALRAESGAEDKARVLDRLAQCLEVRQALLRGLAGEDEGEFLTAVAVRLAPAADLGELRRDHLQHLVADVVSVLVVDPLEVIHVDHRDAVLPAHAQDRLVQRPPRGQPREAVLVRHVVRGLDHGDDQDEGRGGEIER